MKNSWRVILTFSQNSLGKQFRNDLMMLRGYFTPSKKKKKQKQRKTITNTNKNKNKKQTKQNKNKTHTHTQKEKTCFVLYLKININAFLKNNLIVNCPSKELKNSIKIEVGQAVPDLLI